MVGSELGFTDLFLAVLSGVLSAAVVGLIAVFVKQILIPWYRSITYDGVVIAGEWHCIDPGMSQEIIFNLRQRAGNIYGEATFIWDHERDDSVRMYEVVRKFNITGIVRDRFVQLTLLNGNPERFGVNSYLLELCGDGRIMKGTFSFYGLIAHTVQSSHQSLYRDRQLAEMTDGVEKNERKERRKRQLEYELRTIEEAESGQLSMDDDLRF